MIDAIGISALVLGAYLFWRAARRRAHLLRQFDQRRASLETSPWLRELLQQRQGGDFISLDEGERRDKDMIARKRRETGNAN